MAPGESRSPPTSPRGAASADREDELLLETVTAFDEFLEDQQQAAELLRQASHGHWHCDGGFLKLTMARMNLPAHSLGENSYKDEFEAALRIDTANDGTLSVIKAAPQQSSQAETKDRGHDDEAMISSGPQRRRGKPTKDESEQGTQVNQQTHEDAAIMWFSSLPPQNLRLAQRHFRSALHALVTTAQSARRIHQGLNELTSPQSTSA